MTNQTLSSIHDQILCGDAQTQLAQLPDGVADCLITSPPYFQQRDYASEVQIGKEKTPAEYIERLVGVFREAYRTLNDRGCMWIVIGDKYVKGQLLGMPWRLALALQDDNWILRSDIIWHKPNAMPSAVKNRPTTDHEYLFFFTKHAKEYHYDADAIREQHVTFSEKSKMKGGRNHFHKRGSTPEAGKNGGKSNLHDSRWDQAFHPKGRNKRTVWSVSLSKCREAHFAVFPETLVETCIAAGCPERGLVLDPFLGSGVTAAVAKRLGRHYLGIDCSEEYCAMSQRRIDALRGDRRLWA